MYTYKLTIISILILFFFNFTITNAHPLDETGDVKVYDQTQRLLFTPEKTVLTIDLTFYPTEKIKAWESIDTNRDQKLTEEEKTIWMKKGQEASWLEVDRRKIELEATKLTFPDYYDFFGQKIGKVSIEFGANQILGEGAVTYFYQGKDKKLEEITFEANGIDGLKIENIQKKSSEAISFEIQKGVQEENKVLGLTTSNRLNHFLNTYVKAENIPMNLLLFAFVVSFFLGALHALTPGHGKAIVASYLVGSRGTVWHAINLGVIVTITHTTSVFLLGLLSIILTEYVVPATVVRTLNTISGILVLGFGLYLVVKRVRVLRWDVRGGKLDNEVGSEISRNQEFSHQESRFTHRISHLLSFKHNHAYKHNHQIIEITWKNLLPLGISGGIVPCVDALAILIVAISLQKTIFGLLLLVFFSVGLAAALISIGSFAVLAKGQFQKRLSFAAGFEKYVSLMSAIVVTLLGLGILLNFGI